MTKGGFLCYNSPACDVRGEKPLSGEQFAWGKPEVVDYFYFVLKIETRAAVWVRVCECVTSWPDVFCFSMRISTVSGRPFSSPLSCSPWSSWAPTGTMVGFDTSLNGARVSVTRKTSGCCLCHCVLPSVFQSGFPLSCAQASIPVFGEFVWALPLKKKKKGNWIPLLIFDPCSNLSHHPTIGPRVMGALFMRERAGQSQLTGQGQALMKPWDQVVAASASFTGHWAWMSKGSRAPFREKQRGGGMLKPRQPSLSCTNIPSLAPGLVCGRMGQFMAKMRCQIFYNLAEDQTQSMKPPISHA